MLIPLLKANGKYSLVNSQDLSCKGWLEYDCLDFFKEGFARAKIESKWVFVDENEKILKTDFDYNEIREFENGLAPVRRDGLWYFINKNGIEVTRRGYKEYYPKRCGFIEVCTVGKYGISTDPFRVEILECDLPVAEYHSGLIDNSGFEIIPPSKNCFIEVQDNLILVGFDNAYEAVDFNGCNIFNTRDFNFISSFYKDRAIAILRKSKEICIINRDLNTIKSIGIDGKINLGEHCVISGKEKDVFGNALHTLEFQGKWGFINYEGDLVCEYRYDHLQPFIDNIAIAGKIIEEKMKFGILNSNFEELIAFRYDHINPFSEGCAAVELNGKWGVINNNGDEILTPTFNKVGDCVNGYIWVSFGDYKRDCYYGKFGFHNKKGEKICPIIYDGVDNFGSELAIVKLEGKYGLINQKGDHVTAINYDWIFDNRLNFYFVEEAGNKFVINRSGRQFFEKYLNDPDDLPF